MKTIMRILSFLFITSVSIGLFSCKHIPPYNNEERIKVKRSEKFKRLKGAYHITDIEGNVYRTIKIGKQNWMAENLRVGSYNDSKEIPLVTDPISWYNLSTPAYCWYNNDSASFNKKYGALYNYHAINTGKLCPTGWHIPTEKDFRTLISTLDQDANFVRHEVSFTAGGKLKERSTPHWADPNAEATNERSFSALPGGCRSYAGNFSTIGKFGYFGGSTDETSLALRYSTSSAFLRNKTSKYVGVSVRCIKDKK